MPFSASQYDEQFELARRAHVLRQYTRTHKLVPSSNVPDELLRTFANTYLQGLVDIMTSHSGNNSDSPVDARSPRATPQPEVSVTSRMALPPLIAQRGTKYGEGMFSSAPASYQINIRLWAAKYRGKPFVSLSVPPSVPYDHWPRFVAHCFESCLAGANEHNTLYTSMGTPVADPLTFFAEFLSAKRRHDARKHLRLIRWLDGLVATDSQRLLDTDNLKLEQMFGKQDFMPPTVSGVDDEVFALDILCVEKGAVSAATGGRTTASGTGRKNNPASEHQNSFFCVSHPELAKIVEQTFDLPPVMGSSQIRSGKKAIEDQENGPSSDSAPDDGEIAAHGDDELEAIYHLSNAKQRDVMLRKELAKSVTEDTFKIALSKDYHRDRLQFEHRLYISEGQNEAEATNDSNVFAKPKLDVFTVDHDKSLDVNNQKNPKKFSYKKRNPWSNNFATNLPLPQKTKEGGEGHAAQQQLSGIQNDMRAKISKNRKNKAQGRLLVLKEIMNGPPTAAYVVPPLATNKQLVESTLKRASISMGGGPMNSLTAPIPDLPPITDDTPTAMLSTDLKDVIGADFLDEIERKANAVEARRQRIQQILDKRVARFADAPLIYIPTRSESDVSEGGDTNTPISEAFAQERQLTISTNEDKTVNQLAASTKANNATEEGSPLGQVSPSSFKKSVSFMPLGSSSASESVIPIFSVGSGSSVLLEGVMDDVNNMTIEAPPPKALKLILHTESSNINVDGRRVSSIIAPTFITASELSPSLITEIESKFGPQGFPIMHNPYDTNPSGDGISGGLRTAGRDHFVMVPMTKPSLNRSHISKTSSSLADTTSSSVGNPGTEAFQALARSYYQYRDPKVLKAFFVAKLKTGQSVANEGQDRTTMAHPLPMHLQSIMAEQLKGDREVLVCTQFAASAAHSDLPLEELLIEGKGPLSWVVLEAVRGRTASGVHQPPNGTRVQKMAQIIFNRLEQINQRRALPSQHFSVAQGNKTNSIASLKKEIASDKPDLPATVEESLLQYLAAGKRPMPSELGALKHHNSSRSSVVSVSHAQASPSLNQTTRSNGLQVNESSVSALSEIDHSRATFFEKSVAGLPPKSTVHPHSFASTAPTGTGSPLKPNHSQTMALHKSRFDFLKLRKLNQTCGPHEASAFRHTLLAIHEDNPDQHRTHQSGSGSNNSSSDEGNFEYTKANKQTEGKDLSFIHDSGKKKSGKTLPATDNTSTVKLLQGYGLVPAAARDAPSAKVIDTPDPGLRIGVDALEKHRQHRIKKSNLQVALNSSLRVADLESITARPHDLSVLRPAPSLHGSAADLRSFSTEGAMEMTRSNVFASESEILKIQSDRMEEVRPKPSFLHSSDPSELTSDNNLPPMMICSGPIRASFLAATNLMNSKNFLNATNPTAIFEHRNEDNTFSASVGEQLINSSTTTATTTAGPHTIELDQTSITLPTGVVKDRLGNTIQVDGGTIVVGSIAVSTVTGELYRVEGFKKVRKQPLSREEGSKLREQKELISDQEDIRNLLISDPKSDEVKHVLVAHCRRMVRATDPCLSHFVRPTLRVEQHGLVYPQNNHYLKYGSHWGKRLMDFTLGGHHIAYGKDSASATVKASPLVLNFDTIERSQSLGVAEDSLLAARCEFLKALRSYAEDGNNGHGFSEHLKLARAEALNNSAEEDHSRSFESLFVSDDFKKLLAALETIDEHERNAAAAQLTLQQQASTFTAGDSDVKAARNARKALQQAEAARKQRIADKRLLLKQLSFVLRFASTSNKDANLSRNSETKKPKSLADAKLHWHEDIESELLSRFGGAIEESADSSSSAASVDGPIFSFFVKALLAAHQSKMVTSAAPALYTSPSVTFLSDDCCDVIATQLQPTSTIRSLMWINLPVVLALRRMINWYTNGCAGTEDTDKLATTKDEKIEDYLRAADKDLSRFVIRGLPSDHINEWEPREASTGPSLLRELTRPLPIDQPLVDACITHEASQSDGEATHKCPTCCVWVRKSLLPGTGNNELPENGPLDMEGDGGHGHDHNTSDGIIVLIV